MVIALCLMSLPTSALHASDEDASACDVIIEESAEIPAETDEIDATQAADEVSFDAYDPSEEPAADVPAAAEELEDTETDGEAETLVGTNAVVQASKCNQDGPYVGGVTTEATGPANVRTPKTYYLDLNENNYPLPTHRYPDYMQSVGILYPGDKLRIIPETDPNPGKPGNHGHPGKILVKGGEWQELKTGDRLGPLLIAEAVLVGATKPHYYVREITVVDNPVMFNYSGSGTGGTSYYAEQYPGEPGVHDPSYWPAGTMVWVSMPNYHPVEYTYLNDTAYDYGNRPAEVMDPSVQMTSTGDNPTMIYAEDLSSSYNPIDGYVTVGPEFTIHHPQIKGYKFSNVYARNDGDADRNYSPTRVSVSDDGLSSQWRFFFNGATDFNWSFDNQKHGSEADPIRLCITYNEAKTVTLNANGGKIDDLTESTYSFKYRTYWGTYNWRWEDERFDLSKHVPVNSGKVFTGWFADKSCTKLISAAGSSTMYNDFYNYLEDNHLCEKDGYENCAENIDIYAGWASSAATDISGAAISNVVQKTYTGSEITQNPTVKVNGTTLKSGTDYVLSYKNNINTGTATVNIIGKGSYRGVAASTFKIAAMPLTPILTLDQTEFIYDGEYHRPGYTVTTAEGVELSESTDYNVMVYSQSDAGEGEAYVNLRGNYTGSATATFYVLPCPVDDFDAQLTTTSFTYDGTEKKPVPDTITINDERATYEMSYQNNVNVGTGKATITLTGNYSGSKTLTFTIKKQTKTWTVNPDLSNMDLTYSGYEKQPPVTVKSGSTQISSENYIVTYADNINAGTATVTAEGINDSAGWYGSNTFEITKANGWVEFYYSTVSKKTTDVAFTNWLYKSTDGTITYKSSNTKVATVDSANGTVTIKGAGTATITAQAAESNNYKAATASFTLTVEGANPTPTPTPKPSSGFSDVQDPTHAYYNAIYWAADAGITKGYDDGTFGINKACTRGEMIMFLWRYAGKPAPKTVSKSPFKDVPKTHAFYKAILWASQKGITKGYPDGTFGIDRSVSRGECMMFLWRLKGKPAPKTVAKSPFKDVPTTHTFYKAILWGYQKKITTGYTSGAKKGTFGINENCTRGQIVTFLYRAR